MSFDIDKKNMLMKLESCDKSKKGSVDSQIQKLVDLINQSKDLYTTSSCAGRILLITPGERKCDAEWLLAEHEPVEGDKIIDILKNSDLAEIWFKQESLIMHIVCRTHQVAEDLLKLLHDNGLKRAGAISLSRRIVLEIIGTQVVSVPVRLNGIDLMDESALKSLVDKANKKMQINSTSIKTFEDLIKNTFI